MLCGTPLLRLILPGMECRRRGLSPPSENTSDLLTVSLCLHPKRSAVRPLCLFFLLASEIGCTWITGLFFLLFSCPKSNNFLVSFELLPLKYCEAQGKGMAKGRLRRSIVNFQLLIVDYRYRFPWSFTLKLIATTTHHHHHHHPPVILIICKIELIMDQVR